MVFVPPQYRLLQEAEKAHHDLHRYDRRDAGYRRFLARVIIPMCERVPAPAKGLDFRSGPGPTLTLMFSEAGYDMAIYDPYYAARAAAAGRLAGIDDEVGHQPGSLRQLALQTGPHPCVLFFA